MLGCAYRAAIALISRLPGGRWLLAWTDPLHLARRLLWTAVQERTHYASGRLLDVGCGVQPYRRLFEQRVARYVAMDFEPIVRVDVRGDGLALPFRSAAFETVLCNEVAEHVPDPFRLMSEIERVLKPGGTLLLTTPQTWGLHHEPHDYYRYTRYGLHYLARQSGLEVVELRPTCGLWATLAQRLADTVIYTYAARGAGWVVTALSLTLAPVLLSGYALDRLFGLRGDTLDHVLVARKPAR